MPGKKRNQLKHAANDDKKRYSPNRFRFLDPRLDSSYNTENTGEPDKFSRLRKAKVSSRENNRRRIRQIARTRI